MIVPTRRALVLLACGAPLLLLGYLGLPGLDVVTALDAVVVVLVVADGFLAAPPDRIAVRREAPDAFSVGRASSATYRWTNPTGRAARLLVREARPGLLGGAEARRALHVPARETTSERVPVMPVRRGAETGGWLALRSTGPLGLGRRQARIALPWQVRVYPTLPATRLKASLAEAVRRRRSGTRAVRRPGEGRQFESLREWVPGDETRHIDWKATVRRRKLTTRLFEEERRQRLMLVIDTGRLLTEELAGRPRIEYVVQAALLLALAAVYHDDDVGIMVFADRVTHYAAPQRGRRGLRQVLDALAVVEATLVEPDYPAAFRYLAVRNRKRALTVCFTDVIDRFASDALMANVGALRPRHLPLVVTLRNPELEGLAAVRPTDRDDAYRKAAAEDLLEARDDALLAMRRRGAVVLNADPESAGQAAVQVYLDLKRRGRL